MLDIEDIYKIKDKIKRSKEFARYAHAGQNRSDGSPYAKHPIEVSNIVASHTNRLLPRIASCLHDVKEDCDIDDEIIVELFGQNVLDIVNELTMPKLVYPAGCSRDESSGIRTQALVLKARVMSPDSKWVKLADRLHNLRCSRKSWKPERTRAYAKQGFALYKAMKPLPEGSEALANELLEEIVMILIENQDRTNHCEPQS